MIISEPQPEPELDTPMPDTVPDPPSVPDPEPAAAPSQEPPPSLANAEMDRPPDDQTLDQEPHLSELSLRCIQRSDNEEDAREA